MATKGTKAFKKVAYIIIIFGGCLTFFTPVCWSSKNDNSTPSGKDLLENLRPIHLVYFFEPGCRLCDQTRTSILVSLKIDFPQLKIKFANVVEKENKLIQLAIGKLYNVPPEKRLITPAVYVGEHYFIGDIDFKKLQRAVKSYTNSGTDDIWGEAKKQLDELQNIPSLYLNRLKVPALIVAGLIDGVNPCAFSIIIFLITYMSYVKMRRVKMLQVGLLFIVAVFSAYFFTGLGFLEFFRRTNFFPLIRKSVLFAGTFFCGLAGVLSICDYFALKTSSSRKMFLKIPFSLQRKVNTFVGKMIKHNKYLFSAALGAGFLASSVEFICTGQIYLPALIFLSQTSSLRKEVLFSLALYNSFFILPLVGMFTAIYFGLSTKLITQWIAKRFPLAKILLAVVFFLFCMLLILAL